MRHIFAAASLLALAACGLSGQDNETEGAEQSQSSARQADDNLADSMASNDEATDQAIPDSEERPVMQVQVVLDRAGFGPGVIDGKMGLSTENALSGFQEANDLEVSGELDEATKQALAKWQRIPATRVVTIPEDWGDEKYIAVPEEPAEQAKMERLGYSSLDERLAERFHTTVDVLKQLNPGGRPAGAGAEGTTTVNGNDTIARRTPTPTPTPSASGSGTQAAPTSTFRAGQQIRVPNIGGDRIAPGSIEDQNWQRTLTALGVGSDQPEASRIVVSKSEGTLKAYDEDDKLIALFTVSSGSSQFPLPLGDWEITGKSFNPDFSFDPALLEGADESDGKHQLPPGPNNPVGVIWIDLSKEHYGIHGTPEPEQIGRAQSSGCVRLTNWDAARLAQMVSNSTAVEFVA